MTSVPLRDVVRAGSSRGLDFVKEEELNRRTGITASEVVPFAVSEAMANSLDKDDVTHVNIDVQRNSQFDIVAVSDNGSRKLERSDLELILNFENKASSKRGFLRVSRGCLGNALKSIFGYSYALAENKGLAQYPIIVSSGEFEYDIVLKLDKIREKIEYELRSRSRINDGFTSVKVGFPIERSIDDLKATLKKIVKSTYMVNPRRLVTYDLYGEKGSEGVAQESKTVERETVVGWYTEKQFVELFEDFARTNPEFSAKDFIGLFKWFSRKRAIGDILHELNSFNLDVQSEGSVQFVPSTPLKDFSSQAMKHLFEIMKNRSKPIKARSAGNLLGFVGRDNFERISKQHGWSKLRYVRFSGTKRICPEFSHYSLLCKNLDHVEFPYLIELAIYDRGDGEGLELYEAVNFMSSSHDLFASTFDIKYRLGRVGISQSDSVSIVVHIVTPLLPWLNYGKTVLSNIDSCDLMEKAFDKLLPIPRTPRQYIPPSDPRPLSWLPHGKLGDPEYEQRLRLFALEIKAIDAKRTFHVRPRMRGWGYLLEGLNLITKGEFNALAKVINDCRKIKLLPMDIIAPDPDESRHFKGIHRAQNPKVFLEELRTNVREMLDSLPSNITDFFEGEKYYVMMVVEKGEVLSVFSLMCKNYHVPHVSSKGWSNLEIRANIAKQCLWAVAHGLSPVLLLFYDLDPKGIEISETFRKNLKDMEKATGWNPDGKSMIIERFGLNKEQIDTFKLSWIPNLKTGKGRDPKPTVKVLRYIRQYGQRKCEIESLFKSDETLRAAEQICRDAIERYYGSDAKERFKKKEEESKGKLHDVYDSPVWKELASALTKIEEALPEQQPEKEEVQGLTCQEEETEVLLDNTKEGKCPKCGTWFDYDIEKDAGRLFRCRTCKTLMRLKKETFQFFSLDGVLHTQTKGEAQNRIGKLFREERMSIKQIAAEYKISEQHVVDILNELMENTSDGDKP